MFDSLLFLVSSLFIISGRLLLSLGKVAIGTI
jgi:hypothetical protein